jgi:hypothetical protein
VAGRILKPAAEAVGLVRARDDGELVAWPSVHLLDDGLGGR